MLQASMQTQNSNAKMLFNAAVLQWHKNTQEEARLARYAWHKSKSPTLYPTHMCCMLAMAKTPLQPSLAMVPHLFAQAECLHKHQHQCLLLVLLEPIMTIIVYLML